jgi:ADP-heptose:LPS heptosyltransferase
MNRKGTIGIRLEGGIGDHLLGMRLLYFIKTRYPGHKIIGYSDCAGACGQLAVAGMSPYLDEVIPVYQRRRYPTVTTWGELRNIAPKYLKLMQSHEIFFDTWGESYFIPQATKLGFPYMEMLNRPADLVIPEEYRRKARAFLKSWSGYTFVGLDISKSDYRSLKKQQRPVIRFLKVLLRDPKVVVLNFYTSGYEFKHWPKALALNRQEAVEKDSLLRGQLWNINKRVIPVVDHPIAMVAALLKFCRYFIGVDNGIKHLAGALRIRHSVFTHKIPNPYFVWRWAPDADRFLLFSAKDSDLKSHILQAQKIIRGQEL